MSYRVYIKNDYKPEIIQAGPFSWLHCIRYRLLLGVLLPALIILHGYFNGPQPQFDTALHPAGRQAGAGNPVEPIKPGRDHSKPAGTGQADWSTPDEIAADLPGKTTQRSNGLSASVSDKSPDQIDITIAKGDNLARIFSRLGFSPRDLHEIMTSNERTAVLKQLHPGQLISLQAQAGELQALEFEFDLTSTLLVTKKDDNFTSEIITVELGTQVKQAGGVIRDSLFLSGQAAGLSDNLIMQLADIYGWDIDFIMDIRNGDRFNVIYEEKYKNLEKVTEGPVLAAEFINQGRKIRAVRYQREDGTADYYTDTGANMRKAFLRSPLKFSRISSHFNLRRKHPILNRIRAHKGVDYAAPTGTPIKVTGDGVIHHLGNKGGYGKTIIVKHGNKYSTLYAHLSRYKKGLRRGRPVKQGQVIGYVGKSGLATGPHLHYEFLVHGAHRNPLTVALPKAEGVPVAEMDQFKTRTTHLFAMLDASQRSIAGSPGNMELLAGTEDSGQRTENRGQKTVL